MERTSRLVMDGKGSSTNMECVLPIDETRNRRDRLFLVRE